MSTKPTNRRRFLKSGAAFGAVLAGVARPSLSAQSGTGQPQPAGVPLAPEDPTKAPGAPVRPYGERSPFERVVRTPTGTPLQESQGIITPSALHFERHHAGVPTIDPRRHRLMIHGMVDRPLVFTMEELKRLPSVSHVHFIECSGNGFRRRNATTLQEAHGLTSCSEWTGVLLSLLLREAGAHKEASWLVAEGSDAAKMTRSIPLKKAMDDILVAYSQNGEAIRPEQGYPLRLVVPGWEGNICVKWLRRVKVVDQPYMTREETSKYTELMPGGKARQFSFEMDPKSLITFPSGGHKLSGPGLYEITGLAWSGRGAIRKVEVSTNAGASWHAAELQEPVLPLAHTRFRFAWKWDGQEAVLQSRCTDERGDVQPTVAQLVEARGENWGFGYHLNPIESWRVAADGSVHNVPT